MKLPVAVAFRLLIVLACAVPSRAGPPSDPPGLPPLPTDFTKLRSEFGARPDFSEICEIERPDGRAAEAIRSKEWEVAAGVLRPWLVQCPVDAQMHLWQGVVLGELARSEDSALHLRWARGLVGSVLASGDGQTPQTAWVTISIAEEYAVLAALGLKKRGQSLHSDPLVDAITVEDANGRQTTLYFNPRAHFDRLGLQREAPSD